MISKRHTFFYCTLLVLMCSVQSVVAQNTITWMEASFPPYLIHEGAYKGQGYGDTVTNILIANLKQYEHKRIQANISRHYDLFKKGENVCTVGLYKNPEREKFLYFSLPSFFTLPNVIIINRDKYDDFGGSSMVSLTEILKKNTLVIGQAKNRSYGPIIDSIFTKYGTKDNVFVYEGKTLSLSFFEMLKRDRLDGIIGLPEEVFYQAENLGIREQIMTLSIAENQQSLDAWLSYVACSKTPWGNKVIEDINRVLLEQRPKEQYRAAYERWLDEGSISRYRAAYENYFLGEIQ